MKKLKIVVIGAGSSYTPEFVEGILKRIDELPVGELWLVDIEDGKEKLEIITKLTKRMIEKSKQDIKVVSTFDLEQALKNADFVTTQIRVGFLKARELDERIPLSHGILGQETNGAGGFFKALRTIPVLLNISNLMDKLCPNAWLINFTNPVSMVVEAVYKYGKHKKIIGVCNLPISMRMKHIKSLNLDEKDTVFKFIGLNHNVFLCDVINKDKSIMPEIMQDFITTSEKIVENIEPIIWDRDFIKALGAVPCPYHRYYFKYDETLKNAIEKFKNNDTRAEKVEKVEKELFELYKDPNLDHKPEQLSKRGGAYYSDAACNLISSLYNDKNDVQTINIPNNGIIPFLDDDAIIECSCYVSKDGFKPLDNLVVPNAAKGLIFDMKNFEKLAVEVAVTGNREKAIEALTINRLVSDDTKARVIFEELLEAHKKYLPQFFKHEETRVAMSNFKEELQMKGMELIANVGAAKSTYLEALQYAKEGDIQKAKETVEEGRNIFLEAHNIHFDLIAKEAGGEDLPFSLILMHAEDQMLNTETIQILVSEMIDMWEKLNVK